MHEPYHLKCLVKGLRRVFGHHAAVLGNLTQLAGSLGVGALLRHAVGFVGHTVGIGDERLGLNDACAPEVDLRLLLARLRHGLVGDVLHRLALPIGQHLQNGGFIFRGDVVRAFLAS